MNITELTVHELKEKLEKKELTSYEITKAYTKNYNSVKFKKVPRKIFYIVKSLFV